MGDSIRGISWIFEINNNVIIRLWDEIGGGGNLDVQDELSNRRGNDYRRIKINEGNITTYPTFLTRAKGKR